MNWRERAGVLLDALEPGRLATFTTEGYQGWTPKLLATLHQLGVRPDFVVLHRYPVSLSGWEDDARLLQSTARWTADAAAARRQLKTYFGAAHTNVEVLCTENNSIGEKTGKQTTSDHRLLSAYAARPANGTLSLLVINKSPRATLKAACSIAGFQPGPDAAAYAYGILQDEAARTGTASPDIAQTNYTGAAATFHRDFPPYSATVITLSPLQAK